MRLRQAHAILEAATALEALSIEGSTVGFSTALFEWDQPGNNVRVRYDYIDGDVEFNDPDRPNTDTRFYGLQLEPGPGDRNITVSVDFGFGPEQEPVLHQVCEVWAHTPDGAGERFRTGVGKQIAEQVAAAVREHERPYVEAYQRRARSR